MAVHSFTGQTRLYPQPATNARIAEGYAYAVSVANTTGADITAGTLTIESADASLVDFCIADDATWLPLTDYPDCADSAGVAGPATITFTPERPLPAWGECQFSAVCPGPFARVTGTIAGTAVTIIVGRLKHTRYKAFS